MTIRRKISITIVATAAFVAGILFTTAGSNILGLGEDVPRSAAAESFVASKKSADNDSGTLLAFEEAFVEVAESVNPTVVQVKSEIVQRTEGNGFRPFEGTPFEDMFPRENSPREFRRDGLGSGVLIRENGYIVTNNHVVDGSDQIEVKLFDGEFYDASVVGTDPLTDLAVIKIDVEQAPHIEFGSSEDLRVGQWVMAFGSPLSADLDNTVTSGIVSGLGRTSLTLRSLNETSAFIQTDAAVNPGNSGGPLVNMQGELVGINSAIVSRSGGNQGIAFAIPSSIVKRVSDQLIESGSVERGMLGISFEAVSTGLAEAWDVPRGAAQVVQVLNDSGAEKAGIKEGDVITAVDGKVLSDPNEIATIIANRSPGETVTLSVVRDGSDREIRVTLGRRDNVEIASSDASGDSDKTSHGMENLGITLQTVSPELLAARQIDVDGLSGAMIVDVDPSSDSYRDADLRVGDIIVEADRQKIRSSAEFVKIYDDTDSGKSVILKIVRARGDQKSTLFTALEKKE